jgi:hypothetical protein
MSTFFDDYKTWKYFGGVVGATYPVKSQIMNCGMVADGGTSAFSGGQDIKTDFFVLPLEVAMQEAVFNTDLVAERIKMGDENRTHFDRYKRITITKKELRELGFDTLDDKQSAQALQNLTGLISGYRDRQIDLYGFKILKGVFAGALNSGAHIYSLDRSPVTSGISAKDVRDARRLNLNIQKEYNSILMHPDITADAGDAGIIDTVYSTVTTKENILTDNTFDKINNLRIYEDNFVNTDSGKYSSYIFASGKRIIEFNQNYSSVEMKYDPVKGGGQLDVVLTLDMEWHVPGVSYQLAARPTDDQLIAAASWAYSARNKEDIKILELINKVKSEGN